MKRTASIIAMIIMALQVFSLEILTITKKDNTVLTIPTSEIASMTFTGSEQFIDENAVYDADGNSYNIVKIGLQSWTGRNLETTKFKNGDLIMKAGSEAEWLKAAEEGKPAWCYYLDASESGKKYGKLYNWHAVNDGRGIAPDGWRVSTASDWDGLIRFLNAIAAAKLKETGTVNWLKNTDNVTNETGFTALPGGWRSEKGKFNSVGSVGCFWTKNQVNDKDAYYMIIYDNNSTVYKYGNNKGIGYSIRLVKE